jgi:hypothetical protein
MKIFFTCCLWLLITTAFAQDTLRSQDLTNAGDTFVLSITNTFAGFDPLATGPGFNWDFSQLGRNAQRIDSFLDPASTNILFSFFFINSPINSNRSNQATRGQNFQLGVVSVSDVFNYYYNSASQFSQPGFGAVVNGIPLPIAYSPHDVLYKFPLKYNDSDSVSFGYEVDLSSTLGIYYHVNKQRINNVDGWGSLTTPFGTFDVLRVKSVITERDSIYIDSLNFGFNTPVVTTKEYKWLGAGFGLPLLQINTTGNNVISQVLYQDSIRLNSIREIAGFSDEPVVFPNPASDRLYFQYSLRLPMEVNIDLYTTDGKKVFGQKKESAPGKNWGAIELTPLKLAAGLYLVRLEAGESVITRSVQVN